METDQKVVHTRRRCIQLDQVTVFDRMRWPRAGRLNPTLKVYLMVAVRSLIQRQAWMLQGILHLHLHRVLR